MENKFLVIGIAGGTGSGKTTLMKNIINRFGDVVTVLSHDNYYRRHDELTYEESEITGMEGSRTSVIFDLDSPGLVSMIRNGTVSTALVFERGKRHHCVYNTPIMPFEICVRTIKVENDILEQGRLRLDYVIEIRGAKAECTKFELDIIA